MPAREESIVAILLSMERGATLNLSADKSLQVELCSRSWEGWYLILSVYEGCSNVFSFYVS